MQKTKLYSEIKNQLGIVASYKILSHWSPENFDKIALKPLFHEIYAKNEIMLRDQKPFGNCCFLKNTSHFGVPKIFVKIAVKPLFHEIYAKNEIMARNQKPFGNCCFV